jgi:hypothetical protein
VNTASDLNYELEAVGFEERSLVELVVVGVPEVPARVLQHSELVPIRP